MIKRLYKDSIYLLKSAKKYRKLPTYDSLSYIDFSSNDYLGLSKNPILIKSATEAGMEFGAGATGSRLLSGNIKIFEEFESQLAKDKNTEASMIFNSGFQANISVLSSLLDSKILKSKPIVFFDKLNHSSLYQAIFLSKAELIRYKHNDMEHLSDMLKKYANDTSPKFIVTETIFGMDGDVLPIKEIVDLASKYHAFLYLDESHATGVIGKNGYGLSTTVNLSNIPHLIMGTFSKALGVSGGYVACDNIIKEYLINSCPGFIYSTANSPLVIGAAFKAWKLIKNFDLERAKISKRGHYVRNTIKNFGFDTGTSSTHIIPIILGKESSALHAQQALLQYNFIVSCIRPPTIPPGTSRLRIAINISHNDNQIDRLLEIIKKL